MRQESLCSTSVRVNTKTLHHDVITVEYFYREHIGTLGIVLYWETVLYMEVILHGGCPI